MNLASLARIGTTQHFHGVSRSFRHGDGRLYLELEAFCPGLYMYYIYQGDLSSC